MALKLGDQVKDKYTALTGVLVARCEYLTGTTRVSVLCPDALKDGIPQEVWLDEDRLQIVS